MSPTRPPEAPSRPPLEIAYLTSQYPMLSMSFVLREVIELRLGGVRLEVASVNRPDRPAASLSAEERVEAERVYALKAHGVAGALTAHLGALMSRPVAYLRGWVQVARLARLDLRRLAMNVAYLSEAVMVGRWMRERGFRHLHVHLGSQPATVGLYVKLIFGCGLSMTVHGPDEFDDVRGQYLAEKVRACDFICCISHYARSQLMRVSPHAAWGKLLVVRLGVDLTTFAPPALRPRVAGEPFRVLCIGRLTPAKGQHLLIDAVATLAARGRRILLTIVGDGVDRASLRQHADRDGCRGVVDLVGPVNHDGVRAHYAAADCFCLPSFAEGIPVVLMEAMAMEIACVTTRITGIPELVRDGVDGLLVAPSDVDELAAALDALIADPALSRRLGQSARRRVVERYDLRANAAALRAVFEARVERTPP